MPKRRKNKREEKLSRLQRFGLVFYDRPQYTFLLWLTLVVFGVLSYTRFMGREGFPAVAVPISSVSGTYFVNNGQRVDQEVAKPISDLLQKDAAVKTVQTTSGSNFYFIQVDYHEGTDPASANTRLENTVKQAAVVPAQATVEFKPITFSIDPEGQGDNLLIAFFNKSPVNVADLSAKASEAAEYLKGSEGIEGVERVRVVELFRTGTDPATGKAMTEQKAFDRTGVRNGDFAFYPSATLAIKADQLDELKLFDASEAALARLRADPKFAGYDVIVTGNNAEGVRSQIGSLQENLLGGLVAVVLVSFLLISLRASFATALAMSTVLAMTIAGLFVSNHTLNTITLFSLILCLGLIVDDTTIMVEAIDAHRHEKKPRREIIAVAIKRVARASIAGTVTTMLAFVPLMFISGVLGDFIFAIPVTIIISLAVSLLVSLTLVPALGHILIKAGRTISWSPLGGVERAISDWIAGAIRVGRRSRRKLLATGTLAILFSLATIVAAGALFSKVTFNIFPATKDTDAMQVSMRFSPDTDLATAQDIADEVDQKVAETLGENVRRASLYATGQADKATLYIDLTSYKDREVKSPELVANVQSALKDYSKAQLEIRQVDAGPPAGAFGVRVYSDEREKAFKLAQDINAYLSGKEVKRLDGSAAKIARSRIADDSSVTRQNGEQYVEVQASFDATDTTALVTLAQDEVEKDFPSSKVASYGLPQDALRFDFGSESENQESFRAMLVAFPVLIVVMYVLLALQFRSLLQPLLIFVALPFSLLGIVGGLYVTDNPFSFFTMVGIFALIGISVNNTILLTDFANQARASGHRRLEAIASAVQARFRPLLTTSLTSVVALTPLALTDPFWESLAVTLIFGLLSSTLLVLIAFPYYYLAAEFLRIRFSRKQTLTWLVILIAGSVAINVLDQTYYLPIWWLICLLFGPLHRLNYRVFSKQPKATNF